MTTNEIITLRANILGGINAYFREKVSDEDDLEMWNRNGVPDECDEEMLMEIAEDDYVFRYIISRFALLIDF